MVWIKTLAPLPLLLSLLKFACLHGFSYAFCRDVDETAMDILIDFCYTSNIIVEESNVQTLLPAACLLQLAEIQVRLSLFCFDAKRG